MRMESSDALRMSFSAICSSVTGGIDGLTGGGTMSKSNSATLSGVYSRVTVAGIDEDAFVIPNRSPSYAHTIISPFPARMDVRPFLSASLVHTGKNSA